MSLTITNISQFGYSPKLNRYGHTINYYVGENRYLFIFGGLKEFGDDEHNILEFSNELLLFNISKMRWNKDPIETKGIAPQKRNLHTCVVYKDNLIIFGGKSNGYLNDIHLYSISFSFFFKFLSANNKWQELETTGDIPSPRYGHTSVIFGDSMFVFGGYDNNSSSCNDLFELNLSKYNNVKFKKRNVNLENFGVERKTTNKISS
jgi:N-acetylneuraminic acid mutarotase